MCGEFVNIDDFKPSYVWPNPAFPFRLYLDHPNCRIFIIENIAHNWNWMKVYAPYFRENDYFFVYCGWYFSEHFATESEKVFSILNLKKENFFFLFNSAKEMLNLEPFAFQGEIINQNAWLDEETVFRPLKKEKIYDAIYVARKVPFKRHQLASKVQNLALVVGESHGSAEIELPVSKYLNERQLPPDRVCEKINESFCGLILSEQEGACFASSEYLLCGVPVVSTPSLGGRDVWYNEYNSIICEPDSESVAAAVEEFKLKPRKPEVIREMHIDQANFFREKFIKILARVFDKFGVELNPRDYFYKTYIHKLRSSQKPNFDELFCPHNF